MNEFMNSNFIMTLVSEFPHRAFIVIMALGVSLLFGAMLGGWRGKGIPVFWSLLDCVFGRFCDRAFKQNKSRGDLFFRGGLLTLSVLFVAYILSIGTKWGVHFMPLYGMSSVILLSFVFSSGAYLRVMGHIHKTLKDKKSEGTAYFEVATTSRIDLNGLDHSGIARTAIEGAVRSFELFIIIPSLGYLIGGAMGALLLSALGYVSWRIGRNGCGKGSSKGAEGILKVFGCVSAPITAVILVMACVFAPFANALRGGKGAFLCKPYNIGIVSYALNLILGGKVRDIDGWIIDQDWIGPEKVSAQLDIVMIERVKYLLFVAIMLWIFMIVGMVVAYKYSFL